MLDTQTIDRTLLHLTISCGDVQRAQLEKGGSFYRSTSIPMPINQGPASIGRDG